jgi:hypothetical protein
MGRNWGRGTMEIDGGLGCVEGHAIRTGIVWKFGRNNRMDGGRDDYIRVGDSQ